MRCRLGTRDSLPDHWSGRRFLRKHLEHHWSWARINFLVRVTDVLGESPFQDEVRLVAGILALSALHRTLKVECDAVNNFGGEAQLVSVRVFRS